MVLEGEDDRILGGLESALGDGLNYILQHIRIRISSDRSVHRWFAMKTKLQAAAPEYGPKRDPGPAVTKGDGVTDCRSRSTLPRP